MTDPQDLPTTSPNADDLVARCVRAMETQGPAGVDRICDAHPGAADEVRRRLQQLDEMGLLRTEPDAEATPAMIGPYSILREISSGGMGSVYLAEQHEPIHRIVAVKVIKAGLDTVEVVQRFRAEQQALALMSHPGIARVFDAGATDAGRPYFVMEYVPGVPITRYAERARLTVDRRLQLIAQVCEAVEHAHQKGIVHRDLKPGNILVVEEGGRATPKVIDFGIAKAMGLQLIEDPHATLPGQAIGTPEYMSPEQAGSSSDDVDTRTDVYSLGVLLYELLCGALPFDSASLRSKGLAEMHRILAEEVPRRPSTRVTEHTTGKAGTRETTALVRRLRGDLDWITMRALEKDRNRRYPGVLALAEDIRRHLDHEPVLAGPPSMAYRARKLVRRHRVEVAAGALVLLSLVVGLGLAVRYALIADERATEAERARLEVSEALLETKDFFGLARDAVGRMVNKTGLLSRVPSAAPIRRQILQDALDYHRELQARRPRDRDLKRLLITQKMGAANLLDDLGEVDAAVSEAEGALAALDALIATRPVSEPPDGGLVRAKAVLLGDLATIHRNHGRDARSLDLIADAVRHLEQAEAIEPTTGVDRANAGSIWYRFGMYNVHDPKTAIRAFRRALAAYGSAGIADVRLAPRIHATRNALGRVLAMSGEAEQGIAEVRTGIAGLEALAPYSGKNHDLASAYDLLRIACEKAGRTDDAVAAQERCVELFRQVLQEQPEWPKTAEITAGAIAELAELYLKKGDQARAIDLYREAVDGFRALRRRHPGFTGADGHMAMVMGGLAAALTLRSDPPTPARLQEALDLLEECMKILDGLEDLGFAKQVLRENMRTTRARTLDRAGRTEEALALFSRARDTLERLFPDAPDPSLADGYMARLYWHQAECLIKVQRFADVAECTRKGIAHANRLLDSRPDDTLLWDLHERLRNYLAVSHLVRGDVDVAVREADALATTLPRSQQAQLLAARIVAACAARTPDANRRAPLETLAMRMLRQAKTLGFQPAAGWPRGTKFAGLARRDDFKQLFPTR